MANDSPAKSLVDIDLASLRVSERARARFDFVWVKKGEQTTTTTKNNPGGRRRCRSLLLLLSLFFYGIFFAVLFVEYPPAWAASQNGRSRSTHRANLTENTTQKAINQIVGALYILTRVFLCVPLPPTPPPTTVTQDPAGIFELVEVVGNGTYGQVYKVRGGCVVSLHPCACVLACDWKP